MMNDRLKPKRLAHMVASGTLAARIAISPAWVGQV